MVRRLTLLVLLIGIVVPLGPSYSSSEILIIDGFDYGKYSVTHAYIEKYGRPRFEPLPEWVEHFVWDVLGPRWPDYKPSGRSGARNSVDAAEAVLAFIPGRSYFPGRLEELSKDPEMLEETRKIIKYLTPEIIYLLTMKIDNIHEFEEEAEMFEYRKYVLNQIEGLVKLAALPGCSGENGEGNKETEE